MGHHGFMVKPDCLVEAGQAAATVSHAIMDLAQRVKPASDVQPAPHGWDIGAQLLDAVPLWEQHLRNAGEDATNISNKLLAAAEHYSTTDAGSARKFGAIQPGK